MSAFRALTMGVFEWSREDLMMNRRLPHFLYKALGSDAAVLYIGISSQPQARLKEHKKKSSWFVLAVKFEITEFPNRWEAMIAEDDAIKNSRSRHNLHLNPNFRRNGRGRMIAA